MLIIFKLVARRVFACTLVNIISVSRTNTSSFVQKFRQSRSGAFQRLACALVAKKLCRGLTRGWDFSNFRLICIFTSLFGQLRLCRGAISIWSGWKWIWIWLVWEPRGSGGVYRNMHCILCNLAASSICICTQHPAVDVFISFWGF